MPLEKDPRFRGGAMNLDCKVYIGELGNDADERELEQVFSKYGPLSKVWVAKRPPGFAFIEFQDPYDARDACQALNGKVMFGQRIKVEMSSGRSRWPNGRVPQHVLRNPAPSSLGRGGRRSPPVFPPPPAPYDNDRVGDYRRRGGGGGGYGDSRTYRNNTSSSYNSSSVGSSSRFDGGYNNSFRAARSPPRRFYNNAGAGSSPPPFRRRSPSPMSPPPPAAMIRRRSPIGGRSRSRSYSPRPRGRR